MKTYQVVGIGNAIVDVISQSDDSFLDLMGIQKGIMQLVERERGELLYGAMENRRQAPGGSVANTLAGLGNLGLQTAFIGRVHDDALGRFYASEMAKGGTDFVNDPVPGGELPTSRSMIFVSPDGERSMNTYLGISAELGPDDVPVDVAGQAAILFLEGYLYDKPKGKEAFEAAAAACRKGGGKAGIALSDPFCVDRHRADFRRLVRSLDYVIGNEHEWKSLYETDDLGTALEQAAAESGLIVCTRSGHDVVLVQGDQTVTVPVTEIVPVDATGAGDQFAAGFIYGMATGLSLIHI
jgi:sugar/nucleoside kinase (ribokinase family)